MIDFFIKIDFSPKFWRFPRIKNKEDQFILCINVKFSLRNKFVEELIIFQKILYKMIDHY